MCESMLANWMRLDVHSLDCRSGRLKDSLKGVSASAWETYGLSSRVAVTDMVLAVHQLSEWSATESQNSRSILKLAVQLDWVYVDWVTAS
jgi:hypothetical protein